MALAERQACRAIITSAGAPSHATATATRWPSWRSSRAQRIAVVRLPALDCRLTGVISVMRMTDAARSLARRVPADHLAGIVRDARAATLGFLQDIGPERL